MLDDLQQRTPEECEEEYPYLWETARLIVPGGDRRQWALIVSLVVDICPHCRETTGPCNCWNDI
jgi:hypothetical protein